MSAHMAQAFASATDGSGTISSRVTAPFVKSRTAFISATGTPFVFHCDTAAGVFPKCAATAAARPFSASSHEMKSMHASLGQTKPLGQAVTKPTVFSIALMENGRRQRFIDYFNGPPLRGSREALMRRTNLTKGRISQLFDEDQPFGELAARNLAERLHLPHDFFERDPAGRSAVPAETAGAFMAKPVTAEQRALLDDMEELLPEDYDRIRHQIAELAGRMRKHSEYVLKRAGVASPAHPTAPSAKRLPEPSPTGNVRKPAHAKRRAS